jgi:hypothetical protein
MALISSRPRCSRSLYGFGLIGRILNASSFLQGD